MRKLLLVLMSVSSLSFANDLNMATLNCKGMKLTTATTLKEVQDKCVVKKQKGTSHGLYMVVLQNDAYKDDPKTVEDPTCFFASNTPNAILNHCKD